MKRAFFLTNLLFLSIIFLLNSCVATGPKFKPIVIPPEKKDSALVHIYRPNSFFGGGYNIYLFLNDKLIVKLRNGSYTSLYLKPGDYVLKSELSGFLSTDGNKISFKTVPKEIYYIKCFIAGKQIRTRTFTHWPFIKLIDKQKALSEILKTGFQELWDEKREKEKAKESDFLMQ